MDCLLKIGEFVSGLFKAEPLSPKDLITLLLAVVSLGLSLYLFSDKRKKDVEDSRKEFVDSLSELLATRKDIEDQEYAIARDGEGAGSRPALRHLRDKREVLVSRLIHIANRPRILLSSQEYVALAAALIDSGRIGESVSVYKTAMDTAANNFEKATAQRVYGRALINQGELAAGRQHMLDAAALFVALKDDRGFERNRVLLEGAETYRRLVAVSVQKSYFDFARDDLAAIDPILNSAGDTDWKTQLTKEAAFLRNTLLARQPL